nr:RNA-dependent RNA polymerase [Monilinia fructicola mitovirus 11]
MKKLKNNNFFSNLKLYSDVYKAGSMISLSNEKHLKLVIKEIGWRIATLSFLSTKETSRFRLLHNFGMFIIKMNKHHGEVYTVKYLKAAQLCIQKKLAGQPFSSMREIEPDYNFPRLSKSGLPSIIKTIDRSSICNNSYKVIRFYLSLFSIYRIIKIPFNPKLNTITDNFGGSKIHLDDFNVWLRQNSRQILQKFSKLDSKDLTAYSIRTIQKSSPLGPISYRHLIGSYLAFKKFPELFKTLQDYINITNSKNFNTLFQNIEFLIKYFGAKGWNDLPYLGKLSFKEEAAGKLRVFAMVDIITQSLLAPLHDMLFSLFRKLPNDCTHNQQKGFKLAQELSLKYNCSFGFDLSAATDRLPVSSQAAILDGLFGIGDEWKGLLVNRDYHITKNSYSLPESSLRYSVGQPMGALSSWAMLNLVHHMMVQFIAVHLNKIPKGSWYDQYLILGDDLVLFDKEVADRYLLLCKQLGVSINLSKSIVAESKPVLEFAKRTSVNGVDVSALPFKELLTSNNFFGRLAVTTRLVNNGWGKDLFKILTIGNMRSRDKTIDRIYPLVGFLTQLFQNKVIPLSSVLSLITNREKPLSFFGRNINWMKPGTISKVVRHYLKTGVVENSMLSRRDRFFAEVNSITFKSILIHKISKIVNEIVSIDPMITRINIMDQIMNSPDLESFYKNYKGDLELDKPLVDRKYFRSDEFRPFRIMFIGISSIADIFFSSKDNPNYSNLDVLRKGLDVDLNYGKGYSLKVMKYNSLYLDKFNNHKNKYFMSKEFADLELSSLLKDFEDLQSDLTLIKFYLPKTKLSAEVIDNPLKVLDFIKDIHNPQYKVRSDFVKFEGQYLEAEAYVDKPRGFKPIFDWAKPSKINISIF